MTDPATRLSPSADVSRSTAIATKVFIMPGAGINVADWTVVIGEPATFTAVAYDVFGRVIPAASIKPIFRSNNTKIFEVDSLTGVGKALSTGSFAITVRVGFATATTGYIAVKGGTTTPGNKAPTAVITAPAAGATYTQGASVTFTGTGTDSEDGAITGASLAWSSSINGQLGTGASLTTSTLSVGAHTITLTVKDSKGATGTATRTVTISSPTETPPASGSWTYCVNAGNMCQFIGLRDVRLAGPGGTPAVALAAYHSIPCAMYGFASSTSSTLSKLASLVLHCDYGPVKLDTLSVPMAMGPLTGPNVTVPLGSQGVATAQINSGGGTGVYTDGSGSFRTTCSLALMAFNDPIVFPGQPGASHLHVFYGNTGVNANSTPTTLTSSGGSTCRGGSLNRTSYWVPALIDTRTSTAVTPDEGVFYYKSGYNMDPKTIQPMPVGLRMISGNAKATSKADQPYGITWGCRDHYSPDTGSIPTTCPVGDAVRLTVIFPQCWDGKNLDSPDHKSHMSFPTYSSSNRSVCPSTHPIPVPEMTEHFDYPVTNVADAKYWRLASDMYSSSIAAGFSAHADWMNGWDPTIMKTIVTQCLNKAVDCGVGGVGDGRSLY